MARTGYSDAAAAAFQASRELPPDALSEWRAAISRHLAHRPGMRVLDLGAGTDTWAATLTSWYGINVVAVEPSPAMRARSRWPDMLAGHATALPRPWTVHGCPPSSTTCPISRPRPASSAGTAARRPRAHPQRIARPPPRHRAVLLLARGHRSPGHLPQRHQCAHSIRRSRLQLRDPWNQSARSPPPHSPP